MATIPYVQASMVSAVNPGFVAASAGGDVIAPNDHGCLWVNNGSGSTVTVTVAVPGNTKYGIANPDPAIAVVAGRIMPIGPFPADLADPTDGMVHITYSAVTTVTVAGVIQ